MNTSTERKLTGTTSLPNWLFGKATAQELVVLLALQFHAPNIHPSLATLSNESGLGKSTICRVIDGLEKRGWIETERRFRDNGANSSTVYRMLIWANEDMHDVTRETVSTASEPPLPCPAQGQPLVPLWDNPLSHTGTPLVPHRDTPCPTAGHKEEQSKNKTRNKPLEPPLPPIGGAAQADHDQQLITLETLPTTDAPQNAPQGPTVPSEPRQPTQATSMATKAPSRRFQPSLSDVPPDLAAVSHDLLRFWPTRSGQMTEAAWSRMMGQARLIQDHPRGGTEILRSQLADGIAASIDGKRWQSLKFRNWELYGTKASPSGVLIGANFNRRQTPEEAALESIAFIKARDARRAAARAANAANQTVMCEVVA